MLLKRDCALPPGEETLDEGTDETLAKNSSSLDSLEDGSGDMMAGLGFDEVVGLFTAKTRDSAVGDAESSASRACAEEMNHTTSVI